MDTAQWPLVNSDPRHLVNEMGLVVKPSLETMVSSTTTAITCSTGPQVMERKPRPQKEQVLSCPRCQSTNTKFCYYNNYSLTQPRYFCKTCRRYWTEGGSLRNVPVGGGSRKNKRPSTSSTITTKTHTPSTAPSSSLSSSATTSRKLPDVLIPPPSSSSFQNPKFHEGHDLNLAFPQQQMNGNLGEFHAIESNGNNNNNVAAGNTSACSSTTSGVSLSAMELLQNRLSVKGPSPFMPMITAPEASAVYPSMFGLQDFRSASLGFSVDAIVGGGGYGNVQGVQMGGKRVVFPFEDLRQVPSTPAHEFEHNRGQGADPSGFWSGVMGGDAAGSW